MLKKKRREKLNILEILIHFMLRVVDINILISKIRKKNLNLNYWNSLPTSLFSFKTVSKKYIEFVDVHLPACRVVKILKYGSCLKNKTIYELVCA